MLSWRNKSTEKRRHQRLFSNLHSFLFNSSTVMFKKASARAAELNSAQSHQWKVQPEKLLLEGLTCPECTHKAQLQQKSTGALPSERAYFLLKHSTVFVTCQTADRPLSCYGSAQRIPTERVGSLRLFIFRCLQLQFLFWNKTQMNPKEIKPLSREAASFPRQLAQSHAPHPFWGLAGDTARACNTLSS